MIRQTITTTGAAAAIFLPSFTFAAGTFEGGFDAVERARTSAGIADFGSLSDLILLILGAVATLMAVLALGALVWGGISYIISLGDEQKTAQAKRIVLYALIGLIVFGLSALLVNVMINLISA